jgi:ABC-type glycerol-3-phosphate transport system substrate-binding protein
MMKKLSFAIVGAASLALAACGGQSDDSLGDNVTEDVQATSDDLNLLAENAAGAEAEALGNQSEALNTQVEETETEIEADVSNQTEVDAAVNGM